MEQSAIMIVICLFYLLCALWIQFGPRKSEIILIKERYNKILETVESMKNTINCHSRNVNSNTVTICHNIRELKKSIQELTSQINELDKRIIANNNSSDFIGDKINFKEEQL